MFVALVPEIPFSDIPVATLSNDHVAAAVLHAAEQT
jgi:hypothetical protein